VKHLYYILSLVLFVCAGCQFKLSPDNENDNSLLLEVDRYDRLEYRYLTTGDFSALQQMNTEYPIETRTLIEDVVKIGENGITRDDILVHDAHCQDNTLQLKLAMMSNENGFPVALGVIRDVEAPTYDAAVNQQIEEVKGRKPYHNFMEMLETNDIWEVQ